MRERFSLVDQEERGSLRKPIPETQEQGLPETKAGLGQQRSSFVSHHRASKYQDLSNSSLPLGDWREQRARAIWDTVQGRLQAEFQATQMVKLNANLKAILSFLFL